jgi:hypothetical protein
MLCKDAEYKNMDQDGSLGQLYNVQNLIKILYKQPGWAFSFRTTLVPKFVITFSKMLYDLHLFS